MEEMDEITHVPNGHYIYEMSSGKYSYGLITKWGLVDISFFNHRKNMGGNEGIHLDFSS